MKLAKWFTGCFCCCLLLGTSTMADPSATPDDPYLWLEDVLGDRALTWVRARNALTTEALSATPHFEEIRRRLLAVYDSDARIPYVTKHGAFLYNFWRDR